MPNLGYDAAGRLKGYSYYSAASASTETFLSSYIGRDSWLESAVDASSTNTNERPTSSTIAYDAAGREISIRERTVYATIDDRWRFFANDGEGHILRRRDGTEPQAGGAFTQGTTTLDQQTANHHMVYANGQQVAALDEAGTIDALSHVTGFANTNIGSTNVVVQDGETLQSIAQRIYGNSSLWYVLAAANALDANTALVAGTTLKAPEVTTNKNDAATFKPYNPSDITGPTSPGLPYIHAPPSSGCGTLGMIVMIVIAIVVTYFSFGTLAPEMSTMIGGMAVGAVGSGLTLGGVLAAGAIAGAAGSIASQAVGSAMGVAHFSWKQVAVDAVVNAVTEGFGAWGATTDAFGQAVKDGAEGARELSTLGRVASAVVGYGAMVGASVAVGRDPNFSWKAVAATAVGSFLSAELGGKVPTLQGGSPFGKFVNNFEGYVANGTVNAATRSAFGVDTFNWGQIAADAFGNALGSAAIKAISSVQQQQAKASAPFGGGQPYFGPSLFGNGSGADAFSTQAFGSSGSSDAGASMPDLNTPEGVQQAIADLMAQTPVDTRIASLTGGGGLSTTDGRWVPQGMPVSTTDVINTTFSPYYAPVKKFQDLLPSLGTSTPSNADALALVQSAGAAMDVINAAIQNNPALLNDSQFKEAYTALGAEVRSAASYTDFEDLSQSEVAAAWAPVIKSTGYEYVTRADAARQFGVAASEFANADSGFSASLFHEIGTTHYELADRGTEMNLNDLLTDYLSGRGFVTNQMTQALDLAYKLDKGIKGAGGSLSFTGHSLGGGLASAQALATNNHAYTFNAMGLPPALITKLGLNTTNAKQLIQAYQLTTDPLSHLQQSASSSTALGLLDKALGLIVLGDSLSLVDNVVAPQDRGALRMDLATGLLFAHDVNLYPSLGNRIYVPAPSGSSWKTGHFNADLVPGLFDRAWQRAQKFQFYGPN